jgi:pyruvate/2-oxoglutarate dehydrogenase complex dihydrolipoamide dehydrogenase (E3) component
LGIDVFLGEGSFIAPNKLQIGNQTLTFKKAIIVTGTKPIPLVVPGLEHSDYLTNESIFKLSSLPPRLGVIGGGPIGCELSQAFLRLGSKVSLITHASHLLPRDDIIAQERLKKIFEKEGMVIYTQSQVQSVEKKGREKILYLDNSQRLVVDEILVAIGRMPAIDGLNLEHAEVKYDRKKGISTNDYLQTSHPHIYAAGDVSSPYKFTHISQELSKMAVMNALNGHKEKASALVIPWCTYTDPEVAHIGLSEQEAKEHGISVETMMIEMADIDRAVLDGETTGFVKLLVREDSDEIVGATLMASHAGDMISELSVAIASHKGLTALSKAIHPFPTQAQVLQKAATELLKKRMYVAKI